MQRLKGVSAICDRPDHIRSFIRHEISWWRAVFGCAAHIYKEPLSSRYTDIRLRHMSTIVMIFCCVWRRSRCSVKCEVVRCKVALLQQYMTTFATVTRYPVNDIQRIRRSTIGIVSGRSTCRKLANFVLKFLRRHVLAVGPVLHCSTQYQKNKGVHQLLRWPHDAHLDICPSFFALSLIMQCQRRLQISQVKNIDSVFYLSGVAFRPSPPCPQPLLKLCIAIFLLLSGVWGKFRTPSPTFHHRPTLYCMALCSAVVKESRGMTRVAVRYWQNLEYCIHTMKENSEARYCKHCKYICRYSYRLATKALCGTI